MVKSFLRIDIQAIKRELNVRDDKLAKGVAYGEHEKRNKFTASNSYCAEDNMIDAEERMEYEVSKDNWMNLIMNYLRDSEVPEDRNQARKLRIKAAIYTMLEGVLCKKSFSGPLFRCVTKEESIEILKTIIQGFVAIIPGDEAWLTKH